MSSGRAGLPGWWSPLGAGSRASLMPGEAGIRAAGISGPEQVPGLVTARVSAARRARLAFPARRPAYAHFAAELDLLNAIMRARARRADMPRSSRILA